MNLTSDHALIVPVVKRPEYTISLEQPNPDATFAHCTIHVPWTGRVRRQLTEDWKRLTDLHGGPFYVLIPPLDVKLQHFVRLFGFKPELTLTDISTGSSELIYRYKGTLRDGRNL